MANDPVEQDVRRPTGCGDESKGNPEVVGRELRVRQRHNSPGGDHGAEQRELRLGSDERDRQRPEELERHRKAEPDALDRGVEGEVHGAEDDTEQ